MEKYTEEIRILATQILQGVENDTEKATIGIRAINEIIVQNPKLIRFIADEKNQQAFKKIKVPKSNSPTEILAFLGEIQALSKKFNQS